MECKLDNRKRILITGAAGFIGFHLAQKLLKNGVDILGYDNLNEYYDVKLKEDRLKILSCSPRFTFVKGNLEDCYALERLFISFKPNIVINLAAQAGVQYSIENPMSYLNSNVIGFMNVLEMCRKYPVEQFLFASSSSVYGANQKQPFSVEDKTDTPISIYAATKKMNELMSYTYSVQYRIKTIGMRFFTVYGPYGRPDMALYKFTKAINEGKTIKVNNYGNMQRDFTFIDDIITGIIAIIDKSSVLMNISPPYKIYNIGNNQPESLIELINCIEHHLGKKAIMQLLPLPVGDVVSTFADIDELSRDTGFRPITPLNDGVLQFVKWYTQYYK